MIWSLLRILLFLAFVALAAFGATWLVDHGQPILIVIGGLEISLSPLMAAVLALLLVFVIWLLLKLLGFLGALWRFLRGDETALSRYFDKAREQRGFEALAEGLTALASGEPKLALIKAAQAQKLLGRPDLTLLISAQAAERAGDRRQAIRFYKELAQADKTRFAGLYGLMRLKLAEGDTDTALRLAEEAFALKPRHEDTLNTLFALQNRRHEWEKARETLKAELKAGLLPRDVHRRRDAVLALAEAREKAAAGDIEAADRLAIEANRLSPDLVPAAVMASEALRRTGAPRKAARVLRKAWEAAPHPDLAAAWAALQPDETPEERRKRFRPLLRIHPDHPETRMLEAELALAAEDFPAARKALGDLPETSPTVRSLALMAAIEKGQGAPEPVVKAWLARALTAPRGPAWVCRKCGHVHGEWVPVCEKCGAFDSLEWTMPPEQPEDARTAGLLPLIVGRIEDRSTAKDVADTTRDDAPDTAAPTDEEADVPVEAEIVGEETPAEKAGDEEAQKS